LCGSDPRQARSSQRARAFRVSTRRYSLKIVGGSRLSRSLVALRGVELSAAAFGDSGHVLWLESGSTK